MYTDEDDLFLRDYLVPESWSLAQFHQFIARDLDYLPDLPAFFAPADEEWIWGNPLPEATRLETLAGQSNLVFCFEPADERFMYLEKTGVVPGESAPEIVYSNGEAPDQRDIDAGGRGSSIFDEAMNDFGDFDGDDAYGDDE